MRKAVLVLLAVVMTTLGLGSGAASAAPHHQIAPSVQIGYTDSTAPTKAFDLTDGQHLPLGAWLDDRGRRHLSRVYATFDLSGLASTDILGGLLSIREASAADCDKRAIEVWQTTPITKTPTWLTSPTAVRKVGENRTSVPCGTDLVFDVSAALAAAQKSVTFEIRVPANLERNLRYGRMINWNYGLTLSVRHNAPPSILPQYRSNAGFPCDETAPYRRVGSFASLLQALATDPDEDDARNLTYEFAVWPQNDPGARLTLTVERGSVERASSVNVPDGYLTDETAYSWQVRVGDGAATSAWSTACSFVVDKTNPSAPTVSFVAPDQFTFDGHGDQDIRGFEYTWGELPVPTCDYRDYGILVCADPFTGPNKVLATTPGGTATVTLKPPNLGFNVLKVRAIDEAGNSSAMVRYEV